MHAIIISRYDDIALLLRCDFGFFFLGLGKPKSTLSRNRFKIQYITDDNSHLTS